MHPLDIHWVLAFGSVALVAGASLTGMLALSVNPGRLARVMPALVGEMCVTELAVCENESLPTISQRLRVLRGENLITRRRRGKHINYALADQHVMDLVFNALPHATERPAAIPAQLIDLEKAKTT